MLGLILLLIILLIAAYGLLQTGAGRELARGLIEERANQRLRGSLSIGEVTELSLGGFRLRDVLVQDPAGRTVVAIAEIHAEPDLGALLGGELALRELTVRQPVITLRPSRSGSPSLLQTGPPPSSRAGAGGDSSPPMPLRVDRLRVERGQVRSELPQTRDVVVDNIELLASLRAGDTAALEIAALTLDISREGRQLLRVDPLHGALRTGAGESSHLVATLAGSGSHLELVGWAHRPVAGGEPRLQATLELDPWSAELLDGLGMANLRRQAPDWLRGQLLVEGTPSDLLVDLALTSPGGPIDLVAQLTHQKYLAASLQIPSLTLTGVAPDVPVGHVEADLLVHARGGDWPRIELDGQLAAADLDFGSLRLGSLRLDGRAWGALPAAHVDLDASLADLELQGRAVESAELDITGGPQSYRVIGSVDLRDGPRTTSRLDLRWADPVLHLDGEVDVRHDGLHLQTILSGVEVEPGRAVRVAELAVAVEGGRVRASGSWQADTGAVVEASWSDLDLLAVSGRLGLPELPVTGTTAGRMRFSGTPDAPDLTLESTLSDGSAEGIANLASEVEVTYRDGHLNLDVSATSDAGEMALNGWAQLSEAAPSLQALQGAEWDLLLTADIPDLGRLEPLLSDTAPLSGALSARTQLWGDAGAPRIDAAATITGLVNPDLARPLDVEMAFAYDGRRLSGHLSVADTAGELIHSQLEGWLDDLPLEPGAALDALTAAEWQLRTRLAERDLRELVGAGEQLLGPLVLSSEGELTNTPAGLFGELRTRLRWVEAPAPVADGAPAWPEYCGAPGAVTELTAFVEPAGVRLDLYTADHGSASLQATMYVPESWWQWLRDGPLGPASRPVDVEVTASGLDFTRLPFTCPFLTGTTSGTVFLTGPLGDLALDGELQVDALTFGGPNRYPPLSGRIVAEDGVILLDDLSAETAEVTGYLYLDDGFRFEGVTGTVHAEDLPFRYAGLVTVRMTGEGRVAVERQPERTDIRLVLRDLTLHLPEALPRRMLRLTPNPDFVYREQLLAAVVAEESGLAEREGEALPDPPRRRTLEIRVDATEPFRVTRPDFDLEMTADLVATADAMGWRMEGAVEVRGGRVALMGRTFDPIEGRLDFTGEPPIDAAVDLLAVHALDDHPGETVSLHITGMLTKPELTLSTTLPGVTSEAHVAELLLRGRVRGAGAELEGPDAEVESVLQALTTGLLTLTARSDLLQWAPLIVVRPGSNLNEVEVRGGFAADWLIPSFVLGMVTGSYVESRGPADPSDAASPEEEALGGGAAGERRVFQIALPWGLLSITRWEPPAGWSQELRWQP